MRELPSGALTLLFTDVEQSTTMLHTLGTEDFADLVSSHRDVLQHEIDAHGGVIVQTAGDGMFAAFTDADEALAAAVTAQARLCQVAEAGDDPRLRVRMGLHSGDVRVLHGDVYGIAIHAAARIGDCANGDQLVLSEATRSALVTGPAPPCGLVPLGLHRFRGIPEPIRLYQVTHPDLPRNFPAVRTKSIVPGNLPAQVTAFVGRENDLGELAPMVRSDKRLVTLVGPGGCGKTRLAIELADRVADVFDDGTWLVELAAIRDQASVGEAVAAALGIKGEGARQIDDILVSRLADRHLLLVIDNCEHVLAAARSLVQLVLANAPRVHVLATSRQYLDLAGEVGWSVGGLVTPTIEEGPAETERSAAVRLFVDRALDARPDLRLDPATMEVVADITRRLDGIPLALELAASWVRSISVEQLAERLQDRLHLLRRRSGGEPRQQTLHAVVDWSYQLLEPQERLVFERLSVFAGTFSLEGAEEVAAGGTIAASDVLDVLDDLVAKSLVVVDHGRLTRYRMLETIREYAALRLDERGELEQVLARHLEWGGGLADRVLLQDLEPNGPALHDLLDVELPNLRNAISWASERPDQTDGVLRILGGIGTFLWLRGHVSEGRALAERALRSGRGQPHLRARVLMIHGALAVDQFDLDAAATSLEDGRRIARDVGDEHLEGWCETFLGLTTALAGDPQKGQECIARALAIAHRHSTGGMTAGLTYFAALVHALAGDDDAAQVELDEAIRLARVSRSPYVLVRALPVEGRRVLRGGELDRARSLYREALETGDATHDRVGVARSLLVLGETSLRVGELEDAASSLARALPITTLEIGDQSLETRVRLALGAVQLLKGELRAARANAEPGLQLALITGRPNAIVAAQRLLSRLALEGGNVREASAFAEAALQHARLAGRPELVARALGAAVLAAEAGRDLDAAAQLLDELTNLIDEVDDAREWADWSYLAGRVHLALGAREGARLELDAAARAHASLRFWPLVAGDLEALVACWIDIDPDRAIHIAAAVRDLRRRQHSVPAEMDRPVLDRALGLGDAAGRTPVRWSYDIEAVLAAIETDAVSR